MKFPVEIARRSQGVGKSRSFSTNPPQDRRWQRQRIDLELSLNQSSLSLFKATTAKKPMSEYSMHFLIMALSAIGSFLYFYMGAYEARRKCYLEEIKELAQEKNVLLEAAETLFRKTAVDITPPLLRLYSAPDEKKMQAYKETIAAILWQQYRLALLQKKVAREQTGLESCLVERMLLSLPLAQLVGLTHELNCMQTQLEISCRMQEIVLKREKKDFRGALTDAARALHALERWEALLAQTPASSDMDLAASNIAILARKLRVNIYNHEAKIHRALAGRSLKYLKEEELKKSQEYYQQALVLEEDNPVILSSLGFLLIDMAESQKDIKEKKTLLNEALKYQLEAHALDMQSPDIHHGMGYVLYHQERYKQENGEAVDKQVLARALLHFSQVIPSNARLERDKVGILELLGKTTTEQIDQMTEGYNKDQRNYLVLLERGKLFIANCQFPEAEADLQKGRCLYGFDSQLTEEFDDGLVKLEEKKQEYASSRCWCNC